MNFSKLFCKIETANAEMKRIEAELSNETGIAMAQRDFEIKKGKC